MAGQGTPFVLPESVWEGVIDLYVNHGWGANKILKHLDLHIDPKTLLRHLKKRGVSIRKFDERLPEPCKGCGEMFEKDAWNRQLCLTCAPTQAWSQTFYRYGITKPQFDKKLDEQNYLCGLCGKPLPADPKEMRIDHCHEQGHVRDILHNKCNIGLHYIEDSEFVGLAVKYIERHKR